MPLPAYKSALIVGAGHGLSASLARLFAREGLQRRPCRTPAGQARRADRESRPGLCLRRDRRRSGGAFVRRCRAANGYAGRRGLQCQCAHARSARRSRSGRSARTIAVSAFGGFLVGPTGGPAHDRAWFRSDFLHRGVGQRQGLRPVGAFRDGQVRVARPRPEHGSRTRAAGHSRRHFVIDGAIRNPGRVEPPDRPDSMLDPDAIAANYLHVLRQPRSAWSGEIELGPGSSVSDARVGLSWPVDVRQRCEIDNPIPRSGPSRRRHEFRDRPDRLWFRSGSDSISALAAASSDQPVPSTGCS